MQFPDLAPFLCTFPLVNLLPCAGMHWRSKHETSSTCVLQTCASLLCSLGRTSYIGAVMGLVCSRACLFCCA